MTSEQHAQILAEQAKSETFDKYMIGNQNNGGGKLWEVPLPKMIAHGIEETIDEGVYMRTARQQLQQLTYMLEQLFVDLNTLEELPDATKTLMLQIQNLMGMQNE